MASEKNFQPPHIHVQTYTRTPVALSRNPPCEQITLRGAGIPSCIRISRWRTDTCSTSDYPAMTLAVFHSLSISTRLNLHHVKPADLPTWISIHLFATNQIVFLLQRNTFYLIETKTIMSLSWLNCSYSQIIQKRISY